MVSPLTWTTCRSYHPLQTHLELRDIQGKQTFRLTYYRQHTQDVAEPCSPFLHWNRHIFHLSWKNKDYTNCAIELWWAVMSTNIEFDSDMFFNRPLLFLTKRGYHDLPRPHLQFTSTPANEARCHPRNKGCNQLTHTHTQKHDNLPVFFETLLYRLHSMDNILCEVRFLWLWSHAVNTFNRFNNGILFILCNTTWKTTHRWHWKSKINKNKFLI